MELTHSNFKIGHTALALLLLSIGIFQVTRLDRSHDWGDDFAMYLSQAKNLAYGRPFADTGFVPNPNRTCFSPLFYPPGYPLVLAPVYRAVGLDWMALKAVGVAFLILGLLALWVWSLSRQNHALSALLLLGIGFHPWIGFLLNQVLSDIPYLALAYATFAAIDQCERPSSRATWWAVTAALCAILACATRTVGITIPGGFFLYALLSRRRFHPSLWLGMVGAVLAVVIPLALNKEGTNFHPRYIIGNLAYIPSFIEWWTPRGVPPIAAWAAVLLSFLGMRREWQRRGISLPDVVSALYIGMLLLNPCPQISRYLLPLMPLFLFYVLCGASSIPQFREQRWLSISMVAMGLALYWGLSRDVSRLAYARVTDPAPQAFFTAVRETTEPGSLTVFGKARALAFFAERRGMAYHHGPESEVRLFFDAQGVAYVAGSPYDSTEWKTMMARWRQTLPVIYDRDGYLLLRWTRS